ncbi:MAG TPA: DUF4920 domain-containing protein [Edaphocola sp.]|nr:DUF4920 domain-containing protein [Edaphocola sp.]
MKKIILASCLMLGFMSASAQTAAEPKVYGEAFEQAQLLSPGRLPIAMKDSEKLRAVAVTGYVTEVCQKEGCWLKMTTQKGSQDEIFVKMKDHAFLLPKDIAGKRAVVFGTVEKKEQSVAEQQHYLEDAGASKQEIDAIKAPKATFVLVATGVEVY